MFTGLIQDVGTVVGVARGDASTTLTVRTTLVTAEPFRLGDSLAVSGACLTVVAVAADRVSVTAVAETLARTTLGALRPGDRVNLERPLALGGRLDGHLVQGHVDGLGSVLDLREHGDAHRLRVGVPEVLEPYLVPKGSVAVDGVSLTVASLDPGAFEVAVIPHTWQQTTLSSLERGAQVNLETDIVGKYVSRMIEAYREPGTGGGLTAQKLAEHGFL